MRVPVSKRGMQPIGGSCVGREKNNTAQMLYRFSKHLGFVQSKRKRFALSPPKVEESITPTISILVLGNFPFPLSTLAFGEFQQQQRDAYGPQNREVLIGLQEMHRTKDLLNKLIEALKADAELLMRKYNGKLHEIEGWVDGAVRGGSWFCRRVTRHISFSEVERSALTQRIREEESLMEAVGHGLHNVLPLRNGGHPLTLRVDVVIDEEGQSSSQQRSSSSSSSSPSRSQPLNSIEEGVYSTTTHCTLLEQVPTRRIAERSPKLSQ